MIGPGPLDDAVLPAGVRSRFLDDINGLRVHVLDAGQAANPCVLLLHGFPELAYSWRNVMPGLANAGFHVVAPDLRGYGRTTGGDVEPHPLADSTADELAKLPMYYVMDLDKTMPETVAPLENCRFIEDAGHWFQQEQPEAVIDALAVFLRR